MCFRLCRENAIKWIAVIDAALAEGGRLTSGDAQKLAGRLMWATQHLFYRVGRAMIKAIYAQKRTQTGIVGARLRQALRWWRDILSREVSEMRPWVEDSNPPVHLFVDAASTPPRCAAVLVANGEFLYTAMPPPQSLMAQLKERDDNQIMSLVGNSPHLHCRTSCLCHLRQEIIAIMVALSTFAADLTGRKVVLFSDNVGRDGRVAPLLRACCSCALLSQEPSSPRPKGLLKPLIIIH